jgi:hypothetical protein
MHRMTMALYPPKTRFEIVRGALKRKVAVTGFLDCVAIAVTLRMP